MVNIYFVVGVHERFEVVFQLREFSNECRKRIRQGLIHEMMYRLDGCHRNRVIVFILQSKMLCKRLDLGTDANNGFLFSVPGDVNPRQPQMCFVTKQLWIQRTVFELPFEFVIR